MSAPDADVVALWDAEAPSFDEAADHGLGDPAVRRAWRELLLGVLPPVPAAVADLGCGTGTLALLLDAEGYRVDGLDVSPAMVALARRKLAGSAASVRLGDAAHPGLAPSSVDVVLCRHVLWALPEPVEVVRRWVRALRPGGRLVLVEGSWSTGAGLTAERCAEIVGGVCSHVEVRHLPDPALWGREIEDERYLLVARP